MPFSHLSLEEDQDQNEERSIQRCCTDTREEEKGRKMKKTFAKTKNESGSWLLGNSDEL